MVHIEQIDQSDHKVHKWINNNLLMDYVSKNTEELKVPTREHEHFIFYWQVPI